MALDALTATALVAPARGYRSSDPGDDVDVYTAGSDTLYLRMPGVFFVSADCTVSVETVDGSVLTLPVKALWVSPFRVRRLRATGTLLGSALFVVVP